MIKKTLATVVMLSSLLLSNTVMAAGLEDDMKTLGKNYSVHDKFHRTLILSGFCLLKIAKISLNSSFFPKPIKR